MVSGGPRAPRHSTVSKSPLTIASILLWDTGQEEVGQNTKPLALGQWTDSQSGQGKQLSVLLQSYFVTLLAFPLSLE